MHASKPTPPPCTVARPWRAPALAALAFALLLVGAAAMQPLVASADGGRDHDRARAALEAGEILPLETILARVRRQHPGDVLELELEREHGRWVYEIKLLQQGGRVVKLEVDASTGEVLRDRNRRTR